MTAMTIPPMAQPTEDALEALAVLEHRLIAAEAKTAATAAAIKPLHAAFEDALAEDAEGGTDDGPLMSAEREHRRAKAEAAGLRRKIIQQRATIKAMEAKGSVALRAAYADAMKRISGQYATMQKKMVVVLAEAVGLAYAAGDNDIAYAISQIRLPFALEDAPDQTAWRGISTMMSDTPPVENDAARQLAMAACVFQKARTASREDLQAQD